MPECRLPADRPDAEGATATDLVLTVTQILRKAQVVGKFVEFFGDAVETLALPDRATISNMCPEYGATIALFPTDNVTLEYLRQTGRSPDQIDLVERYCKEQGLWRSPGLSPAYSRVIEFDLSTVEPSLAGPRRPQDRIPLSTSKRQWQTDLGKIYGRGGADAAGGDTATATAMRTAMRVQRPTFHHSDARGRRSDHKLHQHLEPASCWRPGYCQEADERGLRTNPG